MAASNFEAKAKNELLQKMHKDKVQNAKSSKETSHLNTIYGNTQKVDHQMQPLTIGNVIQTPQKARPTQAVIESYSCNPTNKTC